MIKLKLTDYGNYDTYPNTTTNIDTDEIKSVEVSYDGGIFSIYINSKEVDLGGCVSQDWNILIQKESK